MSSGQFSITIPKDLLGCFSISEHQQRPAAFPPTSLHANSPHLVPVTQRDRVRFKKKKKSTQSMRQREPIQRWPHPGSCPGAEFGTQCEHVSIHSTRYREKVGRQVKHKVQHQQDSNNKAESPQRPNDMPSVWSAQVEPDANEDHTDSTVAKRTRFIKRDTGGGTILR